MSPLPDHPLLYYDHAQPGVIVWSLSDGRVAAELKGHKFGISCLGFTPNTNNNRVPTFLVRPSSSGRSLACPPHRDTINGMEGFRYLPHIHSGLCAL